MPDISRQSCVTCRKAFTPLKINQKYCTVVCRKSAQNLNRRTRLATVALTHFSKDKLLSSSTYLRDVAGLPRLVQSEWLSLRARVAEADEQIKRWTARRETRAKKYMEVQAAAPELLLVAQILTEKSPPLTIPPEALQIGVACTESSLAFVIFGLPSTHK